MLRRWTFGVLACLTLAACGGGDGVAGPAAVASITVTAPSTTLASIGETVSLTATAKSAKGAVISGATLSWTSSDASVLSVANGVATAVSNGSATITASSGAITGVVQLTVQQVATQLSVTLPSDTLGALGDTVRASGSVRDARGTAVTGRTITWSSQTPTIATVDAATGLITAVAEGNATLIGTSGTVTGQKVVTVRQRAARLLVTRQPAGARAGLAMTTQPQLELQDSRGNRVSGDNATVITASVGSGGGTLSAGSTATAANGVVTFTTLTLGGTAGAKILQFAGTNVSAVSSASFTLNAGTPTSLVVASGSAQTGLANAPLPQPLSAGVRDAFGNGVGSVPVSFTVMQGGGTVNPAEATTDATGNATTTYTLGRAVGAGAVRATSTALGQSQVQFTATGTPNGVIRGTITVQPFNVPAAIRAAAARSASNARATAATTPIAGEFVPGELLVTYRADAMGANAMRASAMRSTSAVAELSTSMRSAIAPMVAEGVVRVAGVSPAMLTTRVLLTPGVSEAEAMRRLRADPRVAAVERNGIMHLDRVLPTQLERALAHEPVRGAVLTGEPLQLGAFGGPLRTMFPADGNYPTNALYASQSWHYNAMALPQAWTLTQGSNSVIVAVVDDGIRFDHPAMAGVLTDDGYDFVPVGTVPLCAGGAISSNGDGDGPDPDPTAPNYVTYNSAGTCVGDTEASGNHGLHVSGTIGATRVNALGIVGVNWQVRIRPVRVMGVHGSGSFFTIAQGVLYAAGLPADDGAGNVIRPSGPPARVINMSLGGTTLNVGLGNAVAAAQANGSLVVASAGNSNNDQTQYPAAFPGVISVSALGPALTKASYSSYGPKVTVAAPGGQTNIGAGVVSSTWNFVARAPRTDSWQGTSMAAPHVSGLAALILAREPGLTVAQLRDRIVNYTVDLGAPGRDDIYGAGLVNARNSLTASMGPARAVYARLVNATTGATVQTVAASNGVYQFNGLVDGSYWVFGGEDESADGKLGLPLRSWGAFGSSAAPTAIVVNGADIYPASFTVSRANEVEPNGTTATANELLPDGYLNGDLTDLTDVDVYRLRITQAGTYTMAVTGQVGACGFANEANPLLTVLSAAGATLGAQDDADAANNDLCSQVTLSLTVGEYYVRISTVKAGRYVVSARRQ